MDERWRIFGRLSHPEQSVIVRDRPWGAMPPSWKALSSMGWKRRLQDGFRLHLTILWLQLRLFEWRNSLKLSCKLCFSTSYLALVFVVVTIIDLSWQQNYQQQQRLHSKHCFSSAAEAPFIEKDLAYFSVDGTLERYLFGRKKFIPWLKGDFVDHTGSKDCWAPVHDKCNAKNAAKRICSTFRDLWWCLYFQVEEKVPRISCLERVSKVLAMTSWVFTKQNLT